MKKYISNITEMTNLKKIKNSKNRENRQTLLSSFEFNNLIDAKKHLGMTKAKAEVVYAVLKDMYNQQVAVAIQHKQSAKAKEKYQQKKIEENTYSYNADLNPLLLETKRFEKMFNTEKKALKPLSIKFISRVAENVEKSFNFKNYYHFENWLRLLNDKVKHTSYTGETIEYEGVEKNVFDKFGIDVKFVKGGKPWGNNKTDIERKISFKNWKCVAFDPATTHIGNNNCGINVIKGLLNIKLDTNEVRKELNIKPKVMLTTEHLNYLYNKYGGKKSLVIIDENYDEDFDMENEDYILYKDNHYTYIIKAEKQNHKEDKDKRKRKGTLIFDIETRATEDIVKIGKNESKILRSAILSIVYQPCRGDKQKMTFVTDKNKNCCEKFLDWLSFESNNKRYYNCVAHNGSRFDFYLIMSYFNQEELLVSETQLRGTSIIGFQYKIHTFKDSCCFLTDSLSNLCDGYLITPEEKAFSKKCDIKLGDKTITNYQLCFYKPELTFWEFMELEEKEPDFWKEYVKYCEYDCLSLYLVWTKFKNQVESVVYRIGNWLPKVVSINTCNTIGSLAKKLLNAVNGNRKGAFPTKAFNKYRKFIMDKSGKIYDNEKYNFICKFKRGGISHTNQLGYHKEGIVGVDIKSQYPTALMFMKIPSGKSVWVNHYDKNYNGYYHINNIKWSKDAKLFKPIASVKDNGVLNWADKNIKDVYVDSYMVKYLFEYCGLISFDVIQGLVSMEEISGKDLFGAYVDTLYSEKAKQDELKNKKDDTYNKPYREVIKLFLNSLTGKLVENPAKYGKLCFYKGEKAKEDKTINGTNAFVDSEENQDAINEWVNAGVMVYSYSKRNLWDYINCLPNKADDVIQVETDGLYFGLPNRDTFVKNLEKLNKNIIKFGDELGNIEEEVNTTEDAFYLGKKDYMIGREKHKPDGSIDYGKSKIRYKGIPKSTIDDEGSSIDLLNRQFYIDRFNGNTVAKTFKTISKVLYGNKQTNNINLSGFNMTRVATPHDFKQFKIYENIDGNVVVKNWEKYIE